MNVSTTLGKSKSVSRRKRWGLRLGAITFGLLIVFGLELSCRALEWGIPTQEDDPFVGFPEATPLFTKSGDFYEIAPARLKFFAAESFPIQKPDDQFRIFVLGGSTVQGRPYSLETTFGTWLQLGLQADNPDRSWDVINCGGLSYASYRLVPILEECLTCQPDLIVLCTGHNEFLEDRSYDHIKPDSQFDRLTMNLSAKSHLFHLFRVLASSVETKDKALNKPQLNGEVDAILDYNDSLKAYHRDDEWRAKIVDHFKFNLERMIDLCRQAEVPIIMIRPPANLADSPPFKSELSNFLSEEESQKIHRLLDIARENYRDNLSKSISSLEAAVQLDPRFALAWYELGQCYLTRKRVKDAKHAFLKARDEDICSLRMVSELEQAMIDITKKKNIYLIDAFHQLEQKSRSGILDSQWLADHVHPTVPGHQFIANEIQIQMSHMSLCKFNLESERRQLAWRHHLDSLDDYYFLKGQETLNSLRGWAAGRADGPPAAERFPKRVVTPKSPTAKEFDSPEAMNPLDSSRK
ncbi:SGNH/GDSL hydrolase family protein [bacterium]|nr:SGNH/GDSL hydrolase family protein [bacterium]